MNWKNNRKKNQWNSHLLNAYSLCYLGNVCECINLFLPYHNDYHNEITNIHYWCRKGGLFSSCRGYESRWLNVSFSLASSPHEVDRNAWTQEKTSKWRHVESGTGWTCFYYNNVLLRTKGLNVSCLLSMHSQRPEIPPGPHSTVSLPPNSTTLRTKHSVTSYHCGTTTQNPNHSSDIDSKQRLWILGYLTRVADNKS